MNDCYEAGLYRQGIDLALEWVEVQKNKGVDEKNIYPLVHYYIAYGYMMLDNEKKTSAGNENPEDFCSMAEKYSRLAENAVADGCFPHRMEDYIVLSSLAERFGLGMARFYLGCLLYDKRVYEEAVADYELAREKCPDFPTVHRNLTLAYYNVYNEPQKAYDELLKAFELDESDSRVYMELDQLRRRMNFPLEERLADMEKHLELVRDRDDMYLEYVTVLNTLGRNKEALELIEKRHFHQWEGGEGKVAAQYLTSLYMLAKKAIADGDYAEAKKLLTQAVGDYPHNLGEGKLESAQENNLYYLLGVVCDKLGEKEYAEECLLKAEKGLSEPVGMMYYNDQPPEMIYYQGLAFAKLGDTEQAEVRFNKLVDYGKKHIDDDVKTDYFAVSLPDLLIFEENLNERNKKHCLFMMSLGFKGLGMTEKYNECAEKLLAMDNAHQGIRVHGGK